MKNGSNGNGHGELDWRSDFPMHEEFEDCAGKMRPFVITAEKGPVGFIVRAVEKGDEDGYELASFSEISPYSALGRLRPKLYRELATRHITGIPGDYKMLHDELTGHISYDSEKGLALIVDGEPIDLQNLARILESHEGWRFRLTFSDPMD